MRQIAYRGALGGCVLGAASPPLWAAEWSITPYYSSSVDYDSNRSLLADGKGSGATVLAVDLKLKRALEDLELTLEPRYALRRFTDGAFGNGDDRSVNAGLNWTRERSLTTVTASYFDQSTLTTEVLETGLVSADTHRRLGQAALGWNYNQTERRAMVAQLSYMDVSYYGRFGSLLPGYRYPMGSLGEQFTFNERGSITLSVFSSRLLSDTKGNSSHEEGLQAGISYLLSERTKLDASLGESKRVLTGESSTGTNASVTLDHSLSLGKVLLTYKRSLVPYGFGFLVEQQQFNAIFNRPLTPYLDCTLSAFRIQNNETAVLLRVDRRNYNSVSAGLNWRPVEEWSLGVVIQGAHTQTPDLVAKPVNEWRSSVSLTWSPYPMTRSW